MPVAPYALPGAPCNRLDCLKGFALQASIWVEQIAQQGKGSSVKSAGREGRPGIHWRKGCVHGRPVVAW